MIYVLCNFYIYIAFISDVTAETIVIVVMIATVETTETVGTIVIAGGTIVIAETIAIVETTEVGTIVIAEMIAIEIATQERTVTGVEAALTETANGMEIVTGMIDVTEIVMIAEIVTGTGNGVVPKTGADCGGRSVKTIAKDLHHLLYLGGATGAQARRGTMGLQNVMTGNVEMIVVMNVVLHHLNQTNVSTTFYLLFSNIIKELSKGWKCLGLRLSNLIPASIRDPGDSMISLQFHYVIDLYGILDF